ncbi:NADPH-dependent F420 reductase [Burkholderia sp. MSMB2157WGS]|uniref:NADPH-dependent F420 reductase n=1 Tax=Burkholderia sp. MSMB2157WGS TaxID=1637928 RepID=UPI0009E9A3E6|nr:NAD(P)-binding domain-containing protein [Burkholderia sp. MSMB2157WGS]
MSIAIIGAGAIGSAIARNLARSGISASIANSRGPQSLQALSDELGPYIRAVSVKEAARADIVFLAVPWDQVATALKDLGPWNARVLVDANNAVEVRIGADNVPSFHAIDFGGRASSELVAQWAPGARVVKAFNHLSAGPLASGPKVDGGRRVLFLAGQDADAKKSVSDLIVRLGFAPIDLGGVDEGRLIQFPGGPLAVINLTQLDQ